jgi:Flp pilus assembly protein TadG
MDLRLQARKRGQRGHIALITAVAALPISLAVVCAVELTALSGERAKMQAAVDAAALAGAREIGVSGGAERNIKAFTERFATEQTQEIIPHVRTRFTAEQLPGGSIQIDGVGVRNSFFGNMVPKGGFVIRVRSLAEALNQQPLCVVATGSSTVTLAIDATERGRILAPDCMVHSNANIQLSDQAEIDAGTIQASGVAEGDGYSPEANDGALVLRDPFKSRGIKRKNACPAWPAPSGAPPSGPLPTGAPAAGVAPTRVISSGVLQLKPGILRWRYSAKGTGQIKLAPGEYYFCEPLTIEEQASLIGDNVVLIFENGALNATGNARVSLTGRRSGSWAGFVLVSTRENQTDTIISSTFVDKLLGIIYFPNSNLFVDAQGSVAEDSLWSVVIARTIALKGETTLVINDNYAGSGVPVPKGVGLLNANNKEGARLRP